MLTIILLSKSKNGPKAPQLLKSEESFTKENIFMYLASILDQLYDIILKHFKKKSKILHLFLFNCHRLFSINLQVLQRTSWSNSNLIPSPGVP